MQIQEIETPNGRFLFAMEKEYVMLTEYRGKDIAVSLPDFVTDKPVTVVGKKAFLGCKDLRELFLPDTITTIQDWAFACCSNLEVIRLPKKELSIGQGILKDCNRLEKICTEQVDSGQKSILEQDAAYLLAATMNKLDAFYLFDTMAAGSMSWLEQWDSRMLFLMEQEDAEGFSKMLLCGEEDYGSRENNLDYYIEQKRRTKVRLAMLRLLHDTGLRQDIRQTLLTYIRAHKKGEASEETWKVVLEEHGDEKPYYQFLIDTECITQKNFDAMLEDMGDYHTEMKAFLMHYQSTKLEKNNVFDSLTFDL
ncbi:MAG: leucine-rich repeat domain-containing protein [Lachnospiraceae bacterium]|nr:leucine-rich repeat domain-containing protein [Lachnospiraceae bacterium]